MIWALAVLCGAACAWRGLKGPARQCFAWSTGKGCILQKLWCPRRGAAGVFGLRPRWTLAIVIEFENRLEWVRPQCNSGCWDNGFGPYAMCNESEATFKLALFYILAEIMT